MNTPADALLSNYLIVGAILFALGTVGFLARRNMIVMFLSAEMMLQGVGLTLVAASRYHGNWYGQVLTIFILVVAASEASLALALVLMLYNRRGSLDVSLWQDLREVGQAAIEPETRALEPAPAEPVLPHLPPAGVEPTPEAEPIHV